MGDAGCTRALSFVAVGVFDPARISDGGAAASRDRRSSAA